MDVWTLDLRPGVRKELTSPACLASRNFSYSEIVFYFHVLLKFSLYGKQIEAWWSTWRIRRWSDVCNVCVHFINPIDVRYFARILRLNTELWSSCITEHIFCVVGWVGLPSVECNLSSSIRHVKWCNLYSLMWSKKRSGHTAVYGLSKTIRS